MEDRFDRLEDRIDQLVAAIARLEDRLSRLEATSRPFVPMTSASAATEEPVERMVAPVAARSADTANLAGVLAILGRAFLVLCGAFLLRGLTEAGILPHALGIVLGYLYAAAWIVMADRAATAGRTLAATLSGCVASIVAYPLLWEAARKFSLLSPDQAVAGVALFTALALAVAWRRRLQTLAAAVTVAALVTDLSLMLSYRAWVSGSLVALALAAYSVWIAYLREWPGMRWPVALALDVLALMMVSKAIAGIDPAMPPGPPAVAVLIFGVGFIVVYLGSFALAMLRMRRRVGAFEVVQGIAILAAGFAPVHHFLKAVHMGDRWFAALTLLAGLVCYATAFVFVDRRFGRGGNFWYFSSLALALSVVGLATATEGALRVALLCGFGIAAAALGARFDRITLRWHSACFLVVAAAIHGTLVRILAAYTAAPAGVARIPSLADLLVIGAAVACYLIFSAAGDRSSSPWPTAIPTFVIAAISGVGLGAVGLMFFSLLLERSGSLNPAPLAAARTVVLALSAGLAAGLGSLRDDRALRWLVYPLLVVCGLKLVAEDLRLGSPAMLFVAFATFGIALIVAPRLLRSGTPPADGAAKT